MTNWQIKLKDKEYIIEADGYTKKRIQKILKEIHPDWEIKKIIKVKEKDKLYG